MLNGKVTKYEFGAAEGIQGIVTHYRIANWDHTWASTAGGAPIDATPNIIDFFYRFTNPAGPSQDYLSSSSSSVSMSSTSSSSVSASSTSTSVSSVSASTTSAPATGAGAGPDGFTTTTFPPTCTQDATDIFAVTDSNQVAWLFNCGWGSMGTMQSVVSVSNWAGCFAACDAYAGCTGFSYVNGATLGAGSGACWLKTASPQAFTSTTSANPTRVAAIMRAATSSKWH